MGKEWLPLPAITVCVNSALAQKGIIKAGVGGTRHAITPSRAEIALGFEDATSGPFAISLARNTIPQWVNVDQYLSGTGETGTLFRAMVTALAVARNLVDRKCKAPI